MSSTVTLKLKVLNVKKMIDDVEHAAGRFHEMAQGIPSFGDMSLASSVSEEASLICRTVIDQILMAACEGLYGSQMTEERLDIECVYWFLHGYALDENKKYCLTEQHKLARQAGICARKTHEEIIKKEIVK